MKVRLPAKLPSRPADTDGVEDLSRPAEEPDDSDEDGTWNRLFVKTQSSKSVKLELKKASKQAKSSGVVNLNATA